MEKGKLNVFRASAGSGKTFELTAQYISLLLSHEVAMPRGILAVTFTQKATQEMKTRILEHLYDIAHWNLNTPPDDFLSKVMQETGQDVPILKRRAATALHTVLHAYDDFYVQTIDSFLQRLLRGLAHELGLSAGFQVDLNDKDTIHHAVDRLMKELPSHNQLREWVTRFTMENMEESGSWNVIKQVKKLAEEITKEAFAKDSDRLQGKLDNKTMGDYQRQLRKMREDAKKLLSEKALSLQQQIGDFNRFSNGGDINKYINKIINDPCQKDIIKKRMKDFLESSDKWLKATDKKNVSLQAEAAMFQPQLVALEELRLRRVGTINSCNASLKLLGELRLIGEVDRLVTELSEESGRFLLGRTPLLFDKLVGDADTSFIYERAGVQFRHIMIDEFQDTSSLQWKTFKRLVDETLSRGYSSMIVGDVKQSIYRWRNGDWETLENIDKVYPSEQFVSKPLDTNYRSDKAILDFNNAFFRDVVSNSLFKEDNTPEEQTELCGIYSDVKQEAGPHAGTGYVRVSVADNDGNLPDSDALAGDEDILLEDLAQQIFSLHEGHGVDYRDMAVLLRYNKDAVAIIRHMSRCHPSIPFVSAEAFWLESSPAVQTVIAALRYLLHPSDTASLLYLLHRYYTLGKHQDIVWEDLVSRRDELLPEALKKAIADLQRLPLYERCERIIALLGLGDWDGQQDYLFCFLDQVKTFLMTERSDTKLFLQYWDDTLYKQPIASAAADGVQLLTIHKSKGLAFHTVFIPYTQWALCEWSTPYKPKTIWCQPDRAPFSDMPLIPIDLKANMGDSIYRDSYLREMFRQRVESLNMLYVACTRAKHNMYVWVNKKADKYEKSVGKLLEEFVVPEGTEAPFLWESGFPVGKVRKETVESSVINPLKVVPVEERVAMPRSVWRVNFKQSTNARDFLESPSGEEQKRRAYMDKGKLLHHIFEGIAQASDAPAAVSAAVQEGLLTAEEGAKTLRYINNRICKGDAKEWFDGTWELYRECAILKRDEQGILKRRRPDRVMERDGLTVVVDFKFGAPDPDYSGQVRRYMELLQGMGRTRIEGYVWYVMQNVIEKV